MLKNDTITDGLPVINSIKTITTSKRFDCCSKCLHFPGCNSVSFMMNASENNCRLSSSIDGVSVSAGLSSEVFKKNPSSVRGCEASPCQSGGTCIDTCEEPFYHCLCPAETKGKHCEPDFKSFHARFTNLGASGRSGPTSIGGFYHGQDHENMITLISGIQHWTVPYTGTYQILAVGASGGRDSSAAAYKGRGAYMRGEFDLSKGEVIKILVGQQGSDNTGASSSGGGGGTFVVTSSNTPLIVAGGGGGIESVTRVYESSNANTGSSGKQNDCISGCTVWSGGKNGQGATQADGSNSGGGGGGFYSSGRSSKQFGGSMGNGGQGGKGFLQGGVGGRSRYNNGDGGFGGGGGAYGNGGGAAGGGGYSGGASGDNWVNSCGGGGGSYNSGANQHNTGGYQANGHGFVEITRLPSGK